MGGDGCGFEPLGTRWWGARGGRPIWAGDCPLQPWLRLPLGTWTWVSADILGFALASQDPAVQQVAYSYPKSLYTCGLIYVPLFGFLGEMGNQGRVSLPCLRSEYRRQSHLWAPWARPSIPALGPLPGATLLPVGLSSGRPSAGAPSWEARKVAGVFIILPTHLRC